MGAAECDLTILLSPEIVRDRVEYFKDQNGVLIVPITPVNNFETFGVSLGTDVKIDENVLFRTETRHDLSKSLKVKSIQNTR